MPKRKKTKVGPVDLRDIEFEKEDIVIPVMKDPKWNVFCKQLTDKQKDLLSLALDPKVHIIFIDGPAGSTKTYMAVYAALRLLSENDDLDITYVRTLAESAEKNMGSLPGNIEEKFCPYSKPLMDKLAEMLKPDVKSQITEGKDPRVELEPINFLRGSNWRNKVAIADECQNFTFNELFTMITRLGENSKLFICGDSMQSDIKSSGFKEMFSLFDDYYSEEKGMHYFEFNEDDIKRHPLQKFIIKRVSDYLKRGKKNPNYTPKL